MLDFSLVWLLQPGLIVFATGLVWLMPVVEGGAESEKLAGCQTNEEWLVMKV